MSTRPDSIAANIAHWTKNNRERVPLVRMSGKWIAAAGFEEGSRYTAFCEDEGRIILTVYRPAPRKRVQGGRA